MPELPEVETMRRGIAGIVGAIIRSVEFPRSTCKSIDVIPSRQTFRRRVVDRRIVQTGRLGKRVLLSIEKGITIVFEPRMTGLVLVTDPPTQKHLRATLRLAEGSEASLCYWDRRGLGSIHAYTATEFAARFHSGQIGPDALNVSSQELRRRLGSSRRAIKVALLDQRAVAGVGNLYACEILHVARVHPAAICSGLSNARWKRIHSAMTTVLRDAIRYEGSTLSDGTYRNALSQNGSYQNHHLVYDRAGLPCKSCGTQIRRIVQAQRATFFCPQCQRRR